MAIEQVSNNIVSPKTETASPFSLKTAISSISGISDLRDAVTKYQKGNYKLSL